MKASLLFSLAMSMTLLGCIGTDVIDEVMFEDPSMDIEIEGDMLEAQLMGRSGYEASGTATLEIDEGGDLILSLSNDFSTDFALGTFIYLSNTTAGGATKAGGLNLGEVTSGGRHTFNVTEADANAELGSYRYIIVLCQPAGITFGFGDFLP